MIDPAGWVNDGAGHEHWFLGTLATVKAPTERTGGVLCAVEFLHPAGFATPRHVHRRADEAFYMLSGSIRGYCGETTFEAAEGQFVWLPRDVPHGYRVDGEVPVRTLAITVPGGFDHFVAEVGIRAQCRALPETVDTPEMAVLLAAADRDRMEILGPPPDEPVR